MVLATPGWQTDDLAEEWVESSPSPPPSTLPKQLGGILPRNTNANTNINSVSAKRGSLRGLGHAPARSLPRSRSTSETIHDERGKAIAKRDVSGNLSPPSSGAEEADEQAAAAGAGAAGTCFVHEGVDDDRGKHLIRNQAKGKDIFGALPLERMFVPPSPPTQSLTTAPPPATTATATSTSPPKGSIEKPEEIVAAASTSAAPEFNMTNTPPRRVSHQYAPLMPSRLSKSITPSNISSSFSSSAPPTEAYPHSSIRDTQPEDDSILQDDTAPQPETETTELHPLGQSTTPDTSPNRPDDSTGDVPQGDFSFVYDAPSHTGIHDEEVEELLDEEDEVGVVEELHGERPTFDPAEISHSTVHGTQKHPGLRLFRSTYDTYTHEHLSALVDSIAIEQSPSHGSSSSSREQTRRSGQGSRSTISSDARSSKRLRLSPPSPPKRAPMRDWGARGMMMMDKIRDIGPGSTTSASRSRTSDEHRSDPTVDYRQSPSQSRSPTPESTAPAKTDRPTHRSNPSTTSSGYLRAAEDLMARIKNRGVSESGSNPDSPANRARQILSETDDNAFASSEADTDGTSDKASMPKTKALSASRTGPSPRRILRRLSASEEIKRATEAGSDSESGGEERFHSTSVRVSTGQSASAPIHSPRNAGPTNMRMIRPDDVQGIVPDQVGKMRYDPTTMRWVRQSGIVDEHGQSKRESEESEDVFAGMESWRDEVRSLRQDMENETAEDEADLVADTTRHFSPSDIESDIESDHEAQQASAHADPIPAPRLFPNPPSISPPARPLPHHANSAPPILTPRPGSSSPPKLRSALRQPNSSTPYHGQKKRAGWHSDLTPAPAGARGKSQTPGSSGARRSVSFSDGKRHGKIEGPDVMFVAKRTTTTTTTTSHEENDVPAEEFFKSKSKSRAAATQDNKAEEQSGEMSWMPSVRTKRIQGMLEGMDELSLEDNATPSKPPKQDMSMRTLPERTGDNKATNDTDAPEDEDTAPIVPFSRRSTRTRPNDTAHGNATFLTECSFGVAHDKLVQLITDVQPFEPYWETLKSIDLRNRGVDSLARLKEFLPALQEIRLDGNRLSYLSGLPSSVLNLHAPNNKLTSLTSVAHLRRIEILDISNNQLDSVYQLECLKNLKELKADGNAITDLGGIASIEGLVSLSVAHNQIKTLDLGRTKWTSLETLLAGNNQITDVRGLEHLELLRTIDLDNNQLSDFSAASAMTTMRTIRISDNDLSHLDMSHFPKLRTLYADGNMISRLNRSGAETSRVENLSLRNQRCSTLRISRSELDPVKRLYISGNKLPTDFFPAFLPNLLYLEAAACSLSTLPPSFADGAMPNLKILNLNYNFITSLEGLSGLGRLRKLTVVGCRLGGKEKGLVRALKGLSGLEELDLRMNPSTLSFYLPLFSHHPSLTTPNTDTDDALPRDKSYIQPTTRLQQSVNLRLKASAERTAGGSAADWAELDGQFRKSLPDEWYGRRLLYRGLVMRACPEVEKLDGLEIRSGERRKAEELLKRAGV